MDPAHPVQRAPSVRNRIALLSRGAPLYRHTLGPTLTLSLAPVTAFAGPVAAYNLALLLGVASTGYAVFLLARYGAGHDMCAWIAGAWWPPVRFWR